MKRLHKIQFIALMLILFGVLSYKTYEQYQNIQKTQRVLIENESEALATFISAFRSTYQDAFVNNHIAVTDKTMKLLPVQTISEISERFSKSLHGDIVIRTVSDRPRNPDNMANNFELEMMDYYRANLTTESKFTQRRGSNFFTKPLYIKPLCMKCHGKREDAVPSIRDKYENAYDYEIGDLRGILSIEIKQRDYFGVLYDDLKYNVIISIIMFMVLGVFIYVLIRKISLMEQKYTEKLKDEVAQKTEEIRQQNIAFETLFEKSLQGTLIIKDSKFVQCNIAIVRMLKYTSKQEILNLHPSKLSPEFQADGKRSVDKADEMMKMAIKKGGYSFEWIHTRADGENFWAYVTLTPISLPDGGIIHVSWIDISQRKELEETVQNYTKNLEDQNKELDSLVKAEVQKNKKQQELLFEQSRMAQMGEMISMIAHQWRQPLGAISATSIDLNLKLELNTFDIENEEGRKEAREYYQKSLMKIDSLVQSLTTTIDDFRNFYKPSKVKELDLLSIPIQKAKAIVQISLEAENIKLIEDCTSSKKLKIHTNELMQVIINILQNAKDNFIINSVEDMQIMIKTFDTDTGSTISISDNGGGINEDFIAKIFDPYFSTKSAKNGTGLGLYMSKIIVEEHHKGILKVENIEDGVCFTIELYKED